MRTLTGPQTLVRIFFGESDSWHHQPPHVALLERLKQEGCAGATLIRGVAGFGASSVIHTVHLLEMSQDLPMVLEFVDTEEQVRRVLPMLDEMIPEGLITLEKVEVVKYLGQQKTKE